MNQNLEKRLMVIWILEKIIFKTFIFCKSLPISELIIIIFFGRDDGKESGKIVCVCLCVCEYVCVIGESSDDINIVIGDIQGCLKV